MYKLTLDPNLIVNLDTGAIIPPGNSQWDLYQEWLSDGNIPDTIYSFAEIQTNKANDISLQCQASICNGFISYALSSAGYHYPAKDTDQQNLASSILDSLLASNATTWETPFWCKDTNGNWAFVQHNITQIQQVGKDAKQAVLTYMGYNQNLQDQITAATTQAQLDAIVWNPPAPTPISLPA